MIVCVYCGIKCKSKAGISRHININHSDIDKTAAELSIVLQLYSRDAIDSIIDDYEKYRIAFYHIPEPLKKYLNLLGIKRSSTEERSTERYKIKYIESIQAKYGSDIQNISQVKEIKDKKLDSISKRYGSIEHYATIKQQQLSSGYSKYINSPKHSSTFCNIEDTCLARYGHKNFGAGVNAKD